jgi:hypothetical protein
MTTEQQSNTISNNNNTSISANNDTISLRIRGIGHDITLSSIDPSTTTLTSIQSIIESRTGLPPLYQRIICNGKTLTSALISKTSNDADGVTLAQLGMVRYGTITKVILMHNSSYNDDKDKIETILKLSNELELLELKGQTMINNKKEKEEEQVQQQNSATLAIGDISNNDDDEIRKLITQQLCQITNICCKLDAIDVSSSPSLRLMRKKNLQRADLLEKTLQNF